MFKGFLHGFRVFIEKGSAIDMAVGIIVGSAMTGVVNSLVKDIMMPPIGLLIGGVDFSNLFVTIHPGTDGQFFYNTIAAAHNAGATTLNIGVFINAFISFMITMFAVFIFVKIANKIRNKKDPSEAEEALAATVRTCPKCMTDGVKKAATVCPFCCSQIKPVK